MHGVYIMSVDVTCVKCHIIRFIFEAHCCQIFFLFVVCIYLTVILITDISLCVIFVL